MYAGQNLESNQSGRSALYIEETDIFVLSKMYSEDKISEIPEGRNHRQRQGGDGIGVTSKVWFPRHGQL